jgi:hypothetical protein
MDNKYSKEYFELVEDKERLLDKPLKTKQLTYFQDAMVRFSKNKYNLTATIILTVMLLLAIFVPVFTPERLYKQTNSALSTLPPKIPLLEYLGIFNGKKQFSNQPIDYTTIDPATGLGYPTVRFDAKYIDFSTLKNTTVIGSDRSSQFRGGTNELIVNRGRTAYSIRSYNEMTFKNDTQITVDINSIGNGAAKLYFSEFMTGTNYQSWNDSVEDHGYFLKNNSRYAAAIGLKDASAQVKAIADAGYATESDYYSITMQILNENNLTQYDNGTYSGGDSVNSEPDDITIEATNYEVVANSEQTGDTLFGRRYRITVSDDSGNALDVSDLHCTFNIKKTIQMQPNSSEITIYNLNVKTENAIMMTGKRVTVEAGYEGNQFGLIFDGDILQTIREREDGTTCKLTILALDSDRAINFDIANFSVARGQTARSIIDHIASKASNPISLGSISTKLEGQTLTRGKVILEKQVII